MKNTKLISLVALSALALTACAGGPQKGPRGGGERGGGDTGFEGYAAKPVALLFAGMDQNDDLTVSGDELISGIDREWERLATAPAIGALEYGRWATSTLGSADALPSFISFDRDLNGRISELEFDDRLRAEFSDLDKDQNGVLDRAELIFRVTRPSRGQQGGQQSQGRGGQDGRRPPPR